MEGTPTNRSKLLSRNRQHQERPVSHHQNLQFLRWPTFATQLKKERKWQHMASSISTSISDITQTSVTLLPSLSFMFPLKYIIILLPCFILCTVTSRASKCLITISVEQNASISGRWRRHRLVQVRRSMEYSQVCPIKISFQLFLRNSRETKLLHPDCFSFLGGWKHEVLDLQ